MNDSYQISFNELWLGYQSMLKQLYEGLSDASWYSEHGQGD